MLKKVGQVVQSVGQVPKVLQIKPRNLTNVLVLKGGWSNEREVSLESGKYVENALSSLGYKYDNFDLVNKYDIPLMMSKIDSFNTNVIFNVIHGEFGEDGEIQSIFEKSYPNIPHTTSNSKASKIAQDKFKAQSLFELNNIPTIEARVVTIKHIENELVNFDKYLINGNNNNNNNYVPHVIKPVCEGSSVGLKVIKTRKDLEMFRDEYVNGIWTFGDEFLYYPFVKGREINVTVFENGVLSDLEFIQTSQTKSSMHTTGGIGSVENSGPVADYNGIDARGNITTDANTDAKDNGSETSDDVSVYTYDLKYSENAHDFKKLLCPAPLSDIERNLVHSYALSAYKLIGCSGLARAEFIMDKNGIFRILEINTVPGLSGESLAPLMANDAGWSYQQLIDNCVQNALAKNGNKVY